MVLTCRLCGVVALSDSFVIHLNTETRRTTYAELINELCPIKLQSDSRRSQHMCKTCKSGIDSFMLVCDNFEENELQPIEEILKVPTKKERRDSSEQIHREPVRSSHRLNSNEEYRTPSATEMESCFVSLERLSIVFVDTDDSDSDSKEVVEIIKPARARKRMREREDKEGSRRSKSRKVEPETPVELIEPKTEPQDASCIEIMTAPPQSRTARKSIPKRKSEFFAFLKTS